MTASMRLFRLTALTLILTFATSTICAAKRPATPMDSAVLHQKLIDHGIGRKVKVTQIDDVVVKGVLVSIDTDSFQITPKGTTQPITFQNSQVAKFGNDGLTTAAKIWIVVAILGALAVLSSRV